MHQLLFTKIHRPPPLVLPDAAVLSCHYILKENIATFFTRFVAEGKATVRLKEPALDFCLSKSDANSLKNFLLAARLSHRGNDTDTRDVEKPKKKLTIVSKKDYPLTSTFPYSLEQLQVSYCNLSQVKMRILSLKALRRLDLSNNHIKKLPATICRLGHLAELVLHNGDALCLSSLQRTLQHLDLKLIKFKLDDNKLVWLPFHIGHISKLRFLSAAHKQLALTFPLTLQEMASRAVANIRLVLYNILFLDNAFSKA
uniref:PIF1/LRR1 pleckstrin homology domain-containing protein n=1 Tax=Hucho hucho TaxID=62062 RepID=A0A4W5REB4_9TELE